MSNDSKPPRIGLWANNYDNGPVASGNCGGIRFVLWRNDKKGNDKAPDYQLVLEAPQRREDAGGGDDTRRDDSRTSGQQAGGGGGFDDSEIPFAPEWR